MHPVALTVAGFDPSSGAGITADLKTFAAHGVYGVACIAALTVQSTRGVRSIKPLGRQLVRQTLQCLAEDVTLSGVKVGMLGGAGPARALSVFLRAQTSSLDRGRVVLDPVLRSSSGTLLIEEEGLRIMRDDLTALIGWITPNLDELSVLTGLKVPGRKEVPAAAARLKDIAARLGNRDLNVLVTGGHLEPPDDFLLTSSGEEIWFPGERILTSSTHGTGCALSSALLCNLISGQSPGEAVSNAKAYVAGALGSAYQVGRGNGPLNHCFCLGGA